MKKVFYVGIAVLVYLVAALGLYGCFRFHSMHVGILTALSLLGILPFTLTAVRSMRGLPVDDRLITIWAWLSMGIGILFRAVENKGTVELILAISFLGISIGSLIQFIRNPKPPAPGPDKNGPLIQAELQSKGHSESIGCAFAFGFLLLMMAPVSQFFIRPRSLFVLASLAAVGLTLMLGGALFGRKKPS